MKIMERIREKAADNMSCSGVTIAFLGDSVTQGCFELYKKDDNIETVFDRENAYHTYLNRIFSMLYPTVPVNIINAGISGDSAPHGLIRLEKDVLRHHPDLVVVCFGLNDANAGLENLEKYETSLKNIFVGLQDAGIEIIFMTPNMMNAQISVHIHDKVILQIAERTCKIQNSGVMDTYMDAARTLCSKMDIPVCDCYARWRTLYENGVDITELLANKINHPTRQMNWLFAISLLETIMQK